MPTTFFVDVNGSDASNGAYESPFFTINKALSSALNGDTIIVGPGTYGTSSVTNITINKSITINGPNSDISYNSVRNPECHLLNHRFAISNNTNNVEINGIHVTGPQLAGQNVFGGDNLTFSNLVVKNSIIEDINGMCLYYQGSGVRNGITFDNCKVSGIGNGTGIGTSSAFNPWLCKNVSITNCLIENVDFNGINLESVENATIKNNVIRNIGKSGVQLANECKGVFEIKNNDFSQLNCRYYGWGKENTRNKLINPYAPRTSNVESQPDWQFFYAGIKWFSNSNPLTHTGTYNIEYNTFDNCWCGYQFARELPKINGPVILFKNNVFQNNSHGDIMLYRPNTTNALYDFRENGLQEATFKVFDSGVATNNQYPNTESSLENWVDILTRNNSNNIVLAKSAQAIVLLEENKINIFSGTDINSIINFMINKQDEQGIESKITLVLQGNQVYTAFDSYLNNNIQSNVIKSKNKLILIKSNGLASIRYKE